MRSRQDKWGWMSFDTWGPNAVPAGNFNLNDKKLSTQLQIIQKTPPKPQQEMNIITTFLISKYVSLLHNPKFDKKKLTVPKSLHLPKSTANKYLNTPRNLRGLGFFCFYTSHIEDKEEDKQTLKEWFDDTQKPQADGSEKLQASYCDNGIDQNLLNFISLLI